MSQGCEGLFGNGMVHGGGANDISLEREMSLLLIKKMHLSTVIAYKESGLTLVMIRGKCTLVMIGGGGLMCPPFFIYFFY